MTTTHILTLRRLLSLSLSTVGFALVLALPIQRVMAQTSATDVKTPPSMAPGAPAGSYALSGFDTVNLYNGFLNFRLPLLKVGGRGAASYTMMLTLEQKWIVNHDFQTGNNWPSYGWWTGLRAGYGPGVMQGRQTHEGCGSGGPYPEGQVSTGSITTLTFTAADGTEYELRDELTGGNRLISTCCCYYQNHANGASRETVFKTVDGTAASFVSDETIYDWSGTVESGPHMIYPNGYFILRDGTRYRIENGLVKWIRDRNGNKLTFTHDTYDRVSTITDSLGRQTTIEYNVTDPVYGLCDRINFTGFGGGSRKIWVGKTALSSVLRADYSLQTFYQLFGMGSSSTQHNPNYITASIWLPDGRRYQLQYNSHGEVARVVLPTGGAYEYDWASWSGPGCDFLPEIYRRVGERRVYPDGTVLEGKTVYGMPGGDVRTVDSLNAGGTLRAREKHYFYGLQGCAPSSLSYSHWKEGREYQTEHFASDGVTLLRRGANTWQQTSPGWSGNWSHEPTNNSKIVTTVETVEPNGVNLVTKRTAINPQTQAIGFDQFNNQTDVWEYGFGTGAPSTHPVRHTHTDYLTVNPANSLDYTGTTVHIRSLASAQQIYSVNPATGAEVLVAKSESKYDETPLLPWYGTVQSWADPGGARGNPTKVRRWLNPGDLWIETRAQFDQVGNVSKSWDAMNNSSEATYSPTYHFAHPTQTTSAVPDPSGQYGSTTALLTSSVFDFWTGLVTSTTDPNGQITSFQYGGLLDRLTAVIRPAGGGRSDFEYGDIVGNLFVRTLTDLDATRRIETYQYFDGLGRGWRNVKSEGATAIYSDTQFDSMGRVWKVSNPYRPGDTILWTTTGYDGLSRVVSVTTPDNAVVTTSYSGNTVTVTDPTGKQRKSVTDALGRLTQVYEDPNGLNYLTSYEYDVRDDLTKVTQDSNPPQNQQTPRVFVYDSLKRLTSATNPESGTISYQYDYNGNLTRKTDARGVYIDYFYDALNRNKTIDYSDTTTINPDITRVYDGAIRGKGRFWYNYAGGSYSVGATVEHIAIDSYDPVGRPEIQRQVFKQNSVWGPTYQISRGYNLASGVITQTYPSGRTVAYSYDAAGRTNSFSGTLGDNFNRTYATITKNPTARGEGWNREEFGTDLPLYHKQRYTNRGQLWDMRLSTVNDVENWNRGAIVNYYSLSNFDSEVERELIPMAISMSSNTRFLTTIKSAVTRCINKTMPTMN